MAKKSRLGYDGVRIGGLTLEQFINNMLKHRWTVQGSLIQEIPINHAAWSMRAIELFLRQVVRTRSSK
jgi:hypothetical protein